MGKIILIIGGARSGKSEFAENILHSSHCERKGYIATSRIWDEEMKTRVISHQVRRPNSWKTWEYPQIQTDDLKNIWPQADIFLFDCVTMYVNNFLMDSYDWTNMESDVLSQHDLDNMTQQLLLNIEKVVAGVCESDAQVIFVSNELGMGIVPDNPLSRLYRDLVGAANQRIAKAATEVYLVISGIPLILRKDDKI